MSKSKYLAFTAGSLFIGLTAAPAFAQQAAPSAPSVTASAPAPAGPSAYQVNLVYTGELWDNAAGGLKRGTTYMQNVDAQLRVDADKAFGWTGGSFVLDGFYESKNSLGNHYVGAVDQQSPIDAAYSQDMFRLYQAYYDQQIGNTDILIGIYDLETEFSTTKPMALFLSKNLTWNTALDQSGTMPQNGSIGPGNYPYTPLAMRVRQTLSPAWSVQGVVADGAADNPKSQAYNNIDISSNYGALGMGEVDYTPAKNTKIMLGAWDETAKLPTNVSVGAKSQFNEYGGYVGGATRLYSPEPRKGLDVFFTAGYSSPKSTNVTESFNGGLTYTGLLNARPTDKIGISFNENIAPSSYKAVAIAANGGFKNNETSFELTYRAPINDWLTMQPDLQYIVNPGYNPNLKNDLVIGIHFEIGHLFDL